MTIEEAYKEAERLLEGAFEGMPQNLKASLGMRQTQYEPRLDVTVAALKERVIRTVAERLMETPV